VRAVEDPDLAPNRAGGVDPPEEVVRQLERARRLERGDAAALRIDPGEDAPDRPVLARRIETLEDEKDAAPALGVEVGLEIGELVEKILEVLLPLLLPGQAERVGRVALLEPRSRARLDDHLLQHPPSLA